LEKAPDALAALQKLENIYNKERPYREIRNIDPLIEKVAKINESLLTEKREHAKSRLDIRIEHVNEQVKSANVPGEISNRALLPLQNAKKRIETLQGVAEIHQEITEAASLEEDAYDLINKFIEEQQAQMAKKAKEEAERASIQGNSTDGNVDYEPTSTKPQKVAEPAPKKIVSIDTSSVMREVNSMGVIETEQDIDSYLSALKGKLTALINSNNKVRIK
jgi:hypothetical protein